MNKPNAITGWLWVKQGFKLFLKQPAELLTLFFAYMFLSMAIGILPVIGQFLPLMLIPVFAMSFMQACRQVEQGKRVYPNLLLTGFRSAAFLKLLQLGLLYIVAAIAAIAISSLVDGGALWDFILGQKPMDEKAMRESSLFAGMLVAALAYLPAMMAFWYAAPLIAWNRMSVGKAVFYSFFAVRGAGRAFTVYGLAWAVLSVLLPTLLSVLVAVIVGQAIVVVLIVIPITLVLTVVMYLSFYPTYTAIFGTPDDSV
ncbi:BPSS1780 family membrane protein [Undibacterium sp.]|uniref:BPSS1780 family membrane protein n=1 Tax=Undibacterium sp. TaxID=1914977 RepID=UPI00374DE420